MRLGQYLQIALVVFLACLSFARLGASSDVTPRSKSVIVEEVSSDSSGAKAGLKPGDRILRYDGKEVASPAALNAAQDNTFGDQEVALEVWRNGVTLTLTATLGPLGLQVRPELSPEIELLYEEGRTALKAKAPEDATTKWEAAAKLALSVGDRSDAAWLYGRAGQIQEGKSQWKQAGEAYLAAWELLKDDSDPAAQSRTLSALGRCMENQSDLTGAEKWFEQARQVDLAAKNEVWAASDLNILGSFAVQRGDLQSAQDSFNQALSIRERQTPNSLSTAGLLENLGYVAEDRGELDSAQDYYARASAIYERLAPDSLAFAKNLNDLGILADDRGDVAGAQDYHSRALGIRERLAPNSLEVAGSLNNLGKVAQSRGDLNAAQEYYNRALEIKERLAPNSLLVASSLTNLGLVAEVRGDLAAAKDDDNRALGIEERLAPNSINIARILNNLGMVAFESNDLDAAQDYYSRALAIKERLAPNSIDMATSLNNLGNVAEKRGDLVVAEENYNRALAIKERLAPKSLKVALSLDDLGNIAEKRGELTTAQDYYNQALAIRERLAPGSITLAESLTDLGTVAFRQSRFSDARSLFSQALAIIEAQRGGIPTADARAFLMAKHEDAFSGLLRANLALHDVPAAFNTSESARARSLLDLLTEGKIEVRQGIDAALLQQERSLQEELNAKAMRQTRLLEGKHTDKESEAATQEVDTLTAAFHQIQTTIRARSPHYAALTQPQPLSVEDVQQQVLDKDSLLLEYALGDSVSYLFVVSQTSIKSYALPKSAEIEALGRRVYEALTARNLHNVKETPAEREIRVAQADSDYPTLAAKLSQMILAPAAAEFGGKRLLIVGDGVLLQTPFAALPDPTSRGSQPLIVSHEVLKLPSASVIAVIRREMVGRKFASKQIAVFGDPVFDRFDERAKTLASMEPVKDVQPLDAGHGRDFERALGEAGLGTDRSSIARLVFSRQEAKAIYSLAPPGTALEALDYDASKGAATSPELADYQILHFATHALLNNDHPELSGIVFSLIDRQGHDVDGFLRLNEIYNLNLPVELVVLSACQTGLGKQIRGEGLIGLVRGFMYAGAPRVVASLWKVDDAATADLMVRFYQNMLKTGESVPESLRHAQVEMSRKERWKSPYFWAAFEMQGEWKR